jgi:uncharacterized NAD(P)/FAD-binding protein YdhS
MSATQSAMKTVLVVGGGLSGTLTTIQLLRKLTSPTPIEIILVEKSGHLGRGVAYGTTCTQHLLNVPAGKMSAFSDKPSHFLDWAQQRDDSIQADIFVPRMVYGAYLEALLEEFKASTEANLQFTTLRDAVVSIKPNPTGQGAWVVFESGLQRNADLIVLATGNYPPSNPYLHNPQFYESTQYRADSWSKEALVNLSNDAPVLLIGTGLTMVDKVMELKAQGYQGIIHALSRHGLLPQPHKLGLAPYLFPAELKSGSVRQLLRHIRQLAKRVIHEGGDWRSVIDGLRPETQGLWKSLSLVEQQRFLRHLRPYWDIYRHRLPVQVAEAVTQLIAEGSLQLHQGRIQSLAESDGQVRVRVQQRHTQVQQEFLVQRVINCTGAESNMARVQDPLIQNLLGQGLIVVDALKLGLETTEWGHLVDVQGHASDFLFTLGSPLRGRLWESTAAPELRQQAERLAHYLMQKLRSCH